MGEICDCGDVTENENQVCDTCIFLKETYGELENDCRRWKSWPGEGRPTL